MNITQHIRQTFETIIYDWSNTVGVPVVFENIETDEQTQTFIQTTLIPTAAEHYTLGSDEYRGIFQLNLYTPKGQSVVEADRLAGEIMQLYPAGYYGDLLIRKPPERTQGQLIDDWYAVSVSINYSMEKK